ncbi:MAG: inorganic phosphate transporter [Rikenellaceae bacterium]
METIFSVIVVILAILAISDLVVGVSNDAVNFLNSAIGSKAAPRYVIMTIASVGILLGSVFSSGMMEVARSGVFNPEMFTFSEIMMVFLAVMFTDVILLDLFNTFGMPTSTTVSLVFELLGSAVAVGLYKVMQADSGTVAAFINSSKAMTIISGILISVVVSFTCGSIVMYITRLIFSFKYKKSFKYIGSIWCGIALTAISYFVIFKGLKSTTLISKDTLTMLNENTGMLVLYMIIGWSIVMAFLQHAFKVNILKIAVLAGTFSLALAFAGNDLVNFIGVFMAGFDSYNIAAQTQDMGMMMGVLKEPVKANTLILVVAGVVMAITLWFSKKARTVTETEVNLSRQNEDGGERFNSTLVSRDLVRIVVNISKFFDAILPKKVKDFMSSRFEKNEEEQEDNGAAFDLIRATVNLTVASLLIALATSLKLPLSTTYVSFMVAMGTSLSDKAWGRESAVYRVTGVLAVISGWFLTAFIAFIASFIVASILMYLEIFGVIGMAILCAYLIFHSTMSHKKREKEAAESKVDLDTDEDIVTICQHELLNATQNVISVYDITLNSLYLEDRKALKKASKDADKLYDQAHDRKYSVHKVIMKLENSDISTGHYYIQSVDYMNEITKALVHISGPAFKHIDNNHSGFSAEQVTDLKEVQEKINNIYNMINHIVKSGDYEKVEQTLFLCDSLYDEFGQIIKRQISRIKSGEASTRSSMLYFDLISETKIIILQSKNVLKAQKNFMAQ